jgi:hypothetical protein
LPLIVHKKSKGKKFMAANHEVEDNHGIIIPYNNEHSLQKGSVGAEEFHEEHVVGDIVFMKKRGCKKQGVLFLLERITAQLFTALYYCAKVERVLREFSLPHHHSYFSHTPKFSIFPS